MTQTGISLTWTGISPTGLAEIDCAPEVDVVALVEVDGGGRGGGEREGAVCAVAG